LEPAHAVAGKVAGTIAGTGIHQIQAVVRCPGEVLPAGLRGADIETTVDLA
jgi:hypothetical protein